MQSAELYLPSLLSTRYRLLEYMCLNLRMSFESVKHFAQPNRSTKWAICWSNSSANMGTFGQFYNVDYNFEDEPAHDEGVSMY